MKTAEEWGRLAVSLPGWRWMPGMLEQRTSERYEDGDGPWVLNKRPDPDDPATEGCIIRLLGRGIYHIRLASLAADGTALWHYFCSEPDDAGEQWSAERLPLGRACIAAAAALGRWPGGAE